jgi:hypothetical protein
MHILIAFQALEGIYNASSYPLKAYIMQAATHSHFLRQGIKQGLVFEQSNGRPGVAGVFAVPCSNVVPCIMVMAGTNCSFSFLPRPRIKGAERISWW